MTRSRHVGGEEAHSLRVRLLDALQSSGEAELLSEADLWVTQLQFYQNATLIHALTDDRDAWFIDYFSYALPQERHRCQAISRSSKEVHEVNAAAPLLLDGGELDYLQFFMHLVRAEDGPFRLVCGPTLAWLQMRLRQSGQHDLAAELAAPQFRGVGTDGACHYTAFVTYADRMFRTELKLLPNGAIEMLEDVPMYEGLAALISSQPADSQTQP